MWQIRSHDLKVSEHDLHDRFLKQARMPSRVHLMRRAETRLCCTGGRRGQVSGASPMRRRLTGRRQQYYHVLWHFHADRRAWMTIDHSFPYGITPTLEVPLPIRRARANHLACRASPTAHVLEDGLPVATPGLHTSRGDSPWSVHNWSQC